MEKECFGSICKIIDQERKEKILLPKVSPCHPRKHAEWKPVAENWFEQFVAMIEFCNHNWQPWMFFLYKFLK